MTTSRDQRNATTGASTAEARVMALLGRHEAALMRVARQWSMCQDDALDALQRGLEIYLRRLETVDLATEAAWLKVVIRHEAIAIRRARGESVARDGLDADAAAVATERTVEDTVLSGERVSRSAQALRALKPDQARALMLKAHGLSYDEIGRQCGWTYTKVNRAITEGRRRFMEVYESLEAGEECARFTPLLKALAEGTASSQQLVAVRPHLRCCPGCRATVRDLYLSRNSRLRLAFPLPAIGLPLRWLRQRLLGGSGEPPVGDGTGPRRIPIHLPAVTDASPSAHSAHIQVPIGYLDRFRRHAASLMHRTNASDLAASIHVATMTGGGRVATLGAVLGMCLSGVGAGTVCVVTGVMQSPLAATAPKQETAERLRSNHRHPPSVAKRPRDPATVEPLITASPPARPPQPTQSKVDHGRTMTVTRPRQTPRRHSVTHPVATPVPDVSEPVASQSTAAVPEDEFNVEASPDADAAVAGSPPSAGGATAHASVASTVSAPPPAAAPTTSSASQKSPVEAEFGP